MYGVPVYVHMFRVAEYEMDAANIDPLLLCFRYILYNSLFILHSSYIYSFSVNYHGRLKNKPNFVLSEDYFEYRLSMIHRPISAL